MDARQSPPTVSELAEVLVELWPEIQIISAVSGQSPQDAIRYVIREVAQSASDLLQG